MSGLQGQTDREIPAGCLRIVAFARVTSCSERTRRSFHIHENETLNEVQFVSWNGQASELPGEPLFYGRRTGFQIGNQLPDAALAASLGRATDGAEGAGGAESD